MTALYQIQIHIFYSKKGQQIANMKWHS